MSMYDERIAKLKKQQNENSQSLKTSQAGSMYDERIAAIKASENPSAKANADIISLFSEKYREDQQKRTENAKRFQEERQEFKSRHGANAWKMRYDFTAGQKEIDDLEAELRRLRMEKLAQGSGVNSRPYAAGQTEVAQYITGYGVTNNRPYAAGQQAQREFEPTDDRIRELEMQIAQKKQDFNQAKQYQKEIAYDDTVKNADFDQYDDYAESDDTLYNWINNLQFRESYEASYQSIPNPNARRSKYIRKGYDQMNASEIAIYNYYYAKSGKEAAQKYLDTIQERLNERTAKNMYSTVKDDTAAEIVFGASVGINQFIASVANNFRFKDDYIPQSAYQIAGKMADEGLADASIPLWYNFKEGKWEDKILGRSLGQIAYDTISTTANMAPSILVGLATGVPVLGTAAMGLSASGGAYQQALNEGYNKNQARGYSMLVGASEIAMEKLLGGISAVGGNALGINMTKNIANADTALKAIAKRVGGSALSEFSEEYLQEVLDPVFSNIMLKTDKEVKPISAEAIYSGILGMLTGAIMEAPFAIYGETKTASTGRKLKEAGCVDSLAKIGNTFAADTVAYKLAGKVNENTGAYTIGQLFNEIGATITEQNINEIAEVLMQTGNFDESTAKKNAQVLAAVVAGAELSRRDVAIIESNDALADAARKVLIDQNTTWNQRTQGYNEVLRKLAMDKVTGKTAPTSKASTPTDNTAEAKTESGEEGNVEPAKYGSIQTIKNGKVTVKMTDGTEVDLKDADLDPDDSVRIETIASIDGISAEDASGIFGILKAGSKNSQYDAIGAREAYRYGYYGLTEKMLDDNGTFSKSLTPEQRKAVYEMGKKARDASVTAETGKIKQMREAAAQKEPAKLRITYNQGNGVVQDIESKTITGLSRKQRAAVSFAKVLHQLGVGTDFEFFESYLSKTLKDKNGNRARVFLDDSGNEVIAYSGVYQTADGKIRIDLNAYSGRGLALNAMSHELVHFIKQWSPDRYRTMADVVGNAYGNTQMSMHQRVLREQTRLERIRGTEVSYDEAYDEVVANALNRMLDDGTVLDRIAEIRKVDGGLADKMIDCIRKFIKRFAKVFSDNESLFYDTEDLMQFKDTVEELRGMFAEALVEASDNRLSSVETEAVESLGENATVETNEDGQLLLAKNESGNVLMYSEQTYQIGGRDKLKAALKQNGHTAEEIINAEVGNRANYEATQSPKWESTVKAVEEKLQKDYAREQYSSQETDTDGFKDYDIVSAIYTIRNKKADRGHDLVKIGTMPALYRKLFGLQGNVYVSNEHLYQNMVSRATAEIEGRFNPDASADYHELGEPKVINAIEQFQDPMVIMESLKDFKEPRLVAILDEKGNDGQNLLAVLELYSEQPAYGVKQNRNHVLITIYEKNSLPDYIEKTVDKGRIMHIKNGISSDTLASLQLAGNISKEILKKNVAQFNKKVKEFKEQNKIYYSTQETDNITARDLLSSTDVATIKNEVVKKKLSDYQKILEVKNAEDQKLREIRAEIKELSFSKGTRDTKKLKDLKFEAIKINNHISVYEGQLQRMEKELQSVVKRERAKVVEEAEKRDKAVLAKEWMDAQVKQSETLREYRETRAELRQQESDTAVMEKEFIRITKEYEKLDAKSGKTISELRTKLKNEAKKHRTDEKIWMAEFGRLMREYEAADRSIDRLEQKIERQKAVAKERVENRNKTAMRHKIQNVVKELNSLLLTNDKKRRVPDNLKKAVEAALDLVNMDTVDAENRAAKYADLIAKEQAMANPDQDKIDSYTMTMENILRQGEKMGKRLEELHAAYEKIRSSDDPDIANAYDPVISGAIQELSETIGNTSLKNMTMEQLSDVYDVYRAVLTRVRDANKAMAENIRASIEELAKSTIREVQTVGGSKKYRVSNLDAVRKFDWNNMKPVYAMERIGSSTLTEVFNNVRAGEDTWAKDISEAREYYLEKSKKYGYDKWDFDKKYRFESNSGIPFELTLEQILSLYAYSKREQAADHLRIGGFVFDSNIETYKEKDGKKSLLKYKVNTADAHQITPEIMADIIGKLSKEQAGFVDEMQDYLSTVMGAKGNEVTSKMYGVKLFKEKFYFPLKSAKQFMFEQNEVSGEVRIKNSGFTNKVVAKANNPVILSNFMDVWSDHVNDMSMYHAFTLPLEDFNRVFNYNTPEKDGIESVSVKGTIQNAYTLAAVDYVKQLITDLNGGARTDSTTGVINKLTGMFKKGAVFASLSVVVQQPSAIARAAALVDTKYFIGPKVDQKRHKYLWAEVKKYAPVAIIKEMGYFDTNMGKSTQDFITGKEYSGIKEKAKAVVTDSAYRDELLSKAPALADEYAWCGIWAAVKRETKAKHPSMDTTSEAFLKLCGKRFTEVITKTQVYDSVLARSANMRSKDTGMKMATAFMAEPTTSINMIEDAIWKAKRGDKKYAGKAIGAVIASQILNSILVSFVYAGRDDDEDETYAEKYIGALTGSLVDGLNVATYIPFIKDIVSITHGYDVERSDMAVVSDLWNAWKNLKNDKVSPYRKVENFAGSIAQIFGLPVKNIMRDVRGIYNTITNLAGAEQTTGSGVKYAISGAIAGKTVSDKEQLYKARLAGDEKHAERVAARYDDEDAADAAVRAAIKDSFMADEIDEATAVKHMVLYAGMDGSEAHWTMDAWKYRKKVGSDEGYGKYGKFHDAVRSGKNLESVIKEYTDNGVETSTLTGEITEEFKPVYLEASNSEKAAMKTKLISAYVACDMEMEDAEKKLDSWDFEAEYGFAYSDRKETYLSGKVSKATLVDILIDRGYDEEDAEAQVEAYEWEAAGFQDVTTSAIRSYNEWCEPAGIPKAVYLEFWRFDNSTENDVDKTTGKKIAYSAVKKIMAYIDSLNLTDAQKDALAKSAGWSEKTIQKYKLW